MVHHDSRWILRDLITPISLPAIIKQILLPRLVVIVQPRRYFRDDEESKEGT